MARTAVLHVGTHKTGTTSFQAMIAHNPDHFRAQGLYYPRAGLVGENHANLAWALADDSRFTPEAGTLADLADELREAQPESVLISSEDFEYLYKRSDRLDMLRLLLEGLGYAVRVVITLRDPVEYLESLYPALVRHGMTREFDVYVAEALEHRGVLFRTWDFRLDYAQLVEGFVQVFGVDSLCVLAYDPVDAAASLLRACRDAFEIPLAPVAGWERINVRDAPHRTEQLIVRRSLASAARWRRLVFVSMPRRRRNASPERSGSRFLLTPEQRDRVEAAFGSAHRALVQEFGPKVG